MTLLGFVVGAVMLVVAIVHVANDRETHLRRQAAATAAKNAQLPRRRAGGIGYNRKARR